MYKYKKRKNGFWRTCALVLLIILISSASIFIYDIYVNSNVYSHEQNKENNMKGKDRDINTEGLDENNTDIFEDVIRCTVGVSKIKNVGDSIFLDDSVNILGLGTGTIVSDDGYILTNSHIAGEKYSICYITLENGNVVEGKVKWSDKDLDLAIIKINGSGLEHVNLGDSDSVKIGEKIYAIGNPTGIDFQRIITNGIICGTNRILKTKDKDKNTNKDINKNKYLEDLIETNALINSNNSGGPLVNSNGEVIGINTVNTVELGNHKTNYFIPINDIKPIIERYINEGEFVEADLGIFAYDKHIASYINPNIKINSGIYVANIFEDGSCFNTELKVGDVITKIDNLELNKMSKLRRYIYTKNDGDEVSLCINRNDKEHIINIKLNKKKQ